MRLRSDGECWRCDTATLLSPDGTEPGGIKRYFCETCSQVTRFKDGVRVDDPVPDAREWIVDTQGAWYPRED